MVSLEHLANRPPQLTVSEITGVDVGAPAMTPTGDGVLSLTMTNVGEGVCSRTRPAGEGHPQVTC